MALMLILSLTFATFFYPCQSQNEPANETMVCNMDQVKGMNFSRMWMSVENTVDINRDGKEIILNGTEDEELELCSTNGIGKGPRVNEAMLEGCKALPNNCKLEDGIIYYYNDSTDCFLKIDSSKNPWGINPKNEPLEPFISVAVNDLPIGTLLEIEELKNMSVPNSTVKHNGCVRVDMPCPKCETGCERIVFFIGVYANRISVPWFDQITVKKSKCSILTYDN